MIFNLISILSTSMCINSGTEQVCKGKNNIAHSSSVCEQKPQLQGKGAEIEPEILVQNPNCSCCLVVKSCPTLLWPLRL